MGRTKHCQVFSPSKMTVERDTPEAAILMAFFICAHGNLPSVCRCINSGGSINCLHGGSLPPITHIFPPEASHFTLDSCFDLCGFISMPEFEPRTSYFVSERSTTAPPLKRATLYIGKGINHLMVQGSNPGWVITCLHVTPTSWACTNCPFPAW